MITGSQWKVKSWHSRKMFKTMIKLNWRHKWVLKEVVKWSGLFWILNNLQQVRKRWEAIAIQDAKDSLFLASLSSHWPILATFVKEKNWACKGLQFINSCIYSFSHSTNKCTKLKNVPGTVVGNVVINCTRQMKRLSSWTIFEAWWETLEGLRFLMFERLTLASGGQEWRRGLGGRIL